MGTAVCRCGETAGGRSLSLSRRQPARSEREGNFNYLLPFFVRGQRIAPLSDAWKRSAADVGGRFGTAKRRVPAPLGELLPYFPFLAPTICFSFPESRMPDGISEAALPNMSNEGRGGLSSREE